VPKRMSLIQSMKRDDEKPLDPVTVEKFVKGRAAKAERPPARRPEPAAGRTAAATPKPADTSAPSAAMSPGLIPVNVRVRPDIAAALKTASLQRELLGIEPYTKREIVEEALEPWLRTNGYL